MSESYNCEQFGWIRKEGSGAMHHYRKESTKIKDRQVPEKRRSQLPLAPTPAKRPPFPPEAWHFVRDPVHRKSWPEKSPTKAAAEPDDLTTNG